MEIYGEGIYKEIAQRKCLFLQLNNIHICLEIIAYDKLLYRHCIFPDWKVCTVWQYHACAGTYMVFNLSRAAVNKQKIHCLINCAEP